MIFITFRVRVDIYNRVTCALISVHSARLRSPIVAICRDLTGYSLDKWCRNLPILRFIIEIWGKLIR